MLKNKVAECGTYYGMDIYSDSELLALAVGISENAACQIDLKNLRNAMDIEGIGNKRLMRIKAVKELFKRMSKRPERKIEIINGPGDAYEAIKSQYSNEMKEHFGAILLNMKSHIIAIKDISVGSLSASIVHPREVFEQAILNHAAAIIVFHNHPSGDPDPSREDIKITHRLVKSGKIMDIPVLDHIILGDNCFISLKEKDLLNE